MKKILILVVAYNAEKTVKLLLDRIPNLLWKKVKEVLVADDSSSDKTFEVAQAYKKSTKKRNLTVIRHERNKGYGGNQKWGYNYAIKKGYDIVVMVHGDAQYPPEYIEKLILPIEQNKADFVFGSRMAGKPLQGGMPLYKFIGNIFLTTVENILIGTRLSEFHSGFRAYSTKALKKIPFRKNSDGFHFDSEIIFQLVGSKLTIAEIVIPTYYGDEKCNVKVIPYGLNVLKEVGKYKLAMWSLREDEKYSSIASQR